MSRFTRLCLVAVMIAVFGLGVGAQGVLAVDSCPIGTYDSGDSCTPCPLGTYQDEEGQTSCKPAEAGSFVDVEGAASATRCEPGTYQPAEGATSCIFADPGYFVDVFGAVAQQACPTGSTSSAGAAVCTVIPTTIHIGIDIKPGSDDNCINNDGNGVIPVAILGSGDFDVTEVDPSTVKLEEMDIKAVGKGSKLLAHIEEVNGDGFPDLMMQILDQDGQLTAGSSEVATLTGKLYADFGGTAIEGTDAICIVPGSETTTTSTTTANFTAIEFLFLPTVTR